MRPGDHRRSTYATTHVLFTLAWRRKGLRLGKLCAFTLVLWTARPLHAQSQWMFDVLLGVSGSPNDGDHGNDISLELSLLRRVGHATSALGLDVGTLRAGKSPERVGACPLDQGCTGLPPDEAYLTQSDKRTRYLGGTYRFDSQVFDSKLNFRFGLGVANTAFTTIVTPFSTVTGSITAAPFTTRISTWAAYGRVGVDVVLTALYENLDLKVAGDSFILASGEGVPVYFRVGLALRFEL